MPNAPHDHEPDDWSRYARHLAGETSGAEAERTRHWIAERDERAHEADDARSTWHAAAPAVDAAAGRRAAIDTGAAWERMATRLAATRDVADDPPARRRVRLTSLGIGLAAAASLAVALVPGLRARVLRRDVVGAADGWTTYATAAGQRASVYLPDGSRADLRAGSTLRVATARSPAPRVVELSGEAIFTVVHDPARPFRVLAGTSVTEDLGTVFAVRAYAGDPTVRVVVAEGAVAIGRRAAMTTTAATTAPSARLVPGDVATLDTTGSVAVVRVDDPRAYLAWSRDRLVFRAERLATVVADLNRAFDGRIAVHDAALAGRRVTLDMPARSLGATIETLTTLLGVDARTVGDSLVLEARP